MLFKNINFVFISVSGLKSEIKTKRQDIKNNADRLYFKEISVHLSKIIDHCAFCPLSQSSPLIVGGTFNITWDNSRYNTKWETVLSSVFLLCTLQT